MTEKPGELLPANSEEKALAPLANKDYLAKDQLLTCSSKIAGLALIGYQPNIFFKFYSINNEPDNCYSLAGDSSGNAILSAKGDLKSMRQRLGL